MKHFNCGQFCHSQAFQLLSRVEGDRQSGTFELLILLTLSQTLSQVLTSSGQTSYILDMGRRPMQIRKKMPQQFLRSPKQDEVGVCLHPALMSSAWHTALQGHWHFLSIN